MNLDTIGEELRRPARVRDARTIGEKIMMERLQDARRAFWKLLLLQAIACLGLIWWWMR